MRLVGTFFFLDQCDCVIRTLVFVISLFVLTLLFRFCVIPSIVTNSGAAAEPVDPVKEAAAREAAAAVSKTTTAATTLVAQGTFV